MQKRQSSQQFSRCQKCRNLKEDGEWTCPHCGSFNHILAALTWITFGMCAAITGLIIFLLTRFPNATTTLATIGSSLFTLFILSIIVANLKKLRSIRKKLNQSSHPTSQKEIPVASQAGSSPVGLNISGNSIPTVERSSFTVNTSVEVLAPRQEHFAFNIDLDIQLFREGLKLSMDRGLTECTDGFSRSLVIGLFHTIAPKNQNTPFIIPYSAVEDIYASVKMKPQAKGQRIQQAFIGKLDQLEVFDLYVVYRNTQKGTRIALNLCAHEVGKEASMGLTVDLYHALLNHKMLGNQKSKAKQDQPIKYNSFVFRNGKAAHTVAELAVLCKTYAQDASYHLSEGHIEKWLRYIDEPKLADCAKTFTGEYGVELLVRVQEFVQILEAGRDKA